VRRFRRWSIVAGLLLGPIVLLLVLRAFPAVDVSWFSPQWHLVAVSGIAACALAAATAALVTAGRSGQPNVIWLGIGCLAVGVCMLGHGLTTPGVMGTPSNQWVGRLPYMAMLVFALCLFAAGRPPTSRINHFVRRAPIAAIVAPATVMAALVAYVTARPLSFGNGEAYGWEENFYDISTLVAIGLLLNFSQQAS